MHKHSAKLLLSVSAGGGGGYSHGRVAHILNAEGLARVDAVMGAGAGVWTFLRQYRRNYKKVLSSTKVDAFSGARIVDICFVKNGSDEWTRTTDLRIMRPSL